MSWQVSYLADQQVVEMLFEGQVTRSEMHACIAATLEAGRVQGSKRLLCDASALTGGHTVFDLYALAENLHALDVPPGLREAIVLPTRAERAAEASFWENTCANRGFEVRCFVDRATAMAWLHSADLSRTGT